MHNKEYIYIHTQVNYIPTKSSIKLLTACFESYIYPKFWVSKTAMEGTESRKDQNKRGRRLLTAIHIQLLSRKPSLKINLQL